MARQEAFLQCPPSYFSQQCQWGAAEFPSECMSLTRARHVKGWPSAKTSVWRQSQGSFLTLDDSVCRTINTTPSGRLQPEIAPLRDLLPRLASYLLIQLYTANPLPAQLYTMNPSPLSVLCHKYAESLGCWCISTRAHSPPNPSLSKRGSVCLSFLHSLKDLVRSSPKMCRSNQVQRHAMPIVNIMILGNSCRFLLKMSIKYNALTIDFIDNKIERQNSVYVMF